MKLNRSKCIYKFNKYPYQKINVKRCMEKKSYYQTEHFKNTYLNKWTVLCEPASNLSSPFFVHKESTPNFYYTTSLVNKAVLFDTEEQAKKYINAANLTKVLPFCLDKTKELLDYIKYNYHTNIRNITKHI
jgi:hypothetical protein